MTALSNQTYAALMEVWQYTSLKDKRYIIRVFGSFGAWMNANSKQLGAQT